MLILANKKVQAVEKIVVNTNWIPIVWVSLIGVIAILKIINAQRLKGYVFALFNKNFIEDELEENTTFLNLFQTLIFLFSITVLALSLSFILSDRYPKFPLEFPNFIYIFCVITLYFLIRTTIESAFGSLFLIKKQLRFYIVSKYSYLYSFSFLLFILFLLFSYSPLKPVVFSYLTVCLFLFKFVFHVVNNKKLIFSKLFYFILYICALEIAPLLILFKLML